MTPLMWQPEVWWTLFTQFLPLSLMAVGGAITLVPDMQQRLVVDHHLLSQNDFTGAIALAQAAPGPNVLFVALMGWYSAGLGGAVSSMLGVMLPSTTVTLLLSRWVSARRTWMSVQAFQAGLVPVTLGLLLATGALLAPSPAQHPTASLLAIAVALLVWRTRLPLIWLVGTGALAGAMGWV
jgi:chromate transporter